jgi:KipI family sensor histidine kinase inhibitor
VPGVTHPVPVIQPLGDGAVLVELGSTVDLETNRRVHALAGRVSAATAGLQGWGVPVPGASSLLVPIDPLEPGVEAATELLAGLERAASADAVSADQPPAGSDDASEDASILEIPTRYDGPDLAAVAEMTGLTPEQIAERHSASTYMALFLGFVPGFAYLGPLDAAMALPRRPVPRTRVPAGSVAIAGTQTAVYPIESPGGWWLIGRTDLVLWNPQREPPALLRPGARVRFVAVTDGR